MNDINYLVAFVNGIVSFFTPCILPLLPVYFGYLAGEAITNIQTDKTLRKKLLINAIGFVLGLSTINIMLGFGAKAIITILITFKDFLRISGGILLILFGLYFIIDIKLRIIEKERKIYYTKYSPNFLKSFLLGITFSFGWTPCNGPILASILMLAGFEANYLRAGSLMLTYSIGFSIMFLISALLVGTLINRLGNISKYFKGIKIISGTILIIMGVLLIMNKVSLLNVIS